MALSARDLRKILEIIDVIHSVPDNAAMFRSVCEKLQGIINIYSAIFVPADRKTGALLFSGYEIFNNYESVATLFANHYAALDPLLLKPEWFRSHPNVAARNTEHVQEGILTRSEFGCDFLMSIASVFYILASTLEAQGDFVGIAGFHRQRQAGDFSDRDKDIVNTVLPHMAKAVHNRNLMNRVVQSTVPGGVIALGEDGGPFFMNEAAKQILKGIPAESIPDPGMSSGPVFYKCKSGTYRVRTLPFGRYRKGRVVLLERYPPEHRLHPKLDESRLSRREKEIAVLAIQGHSNREIAELSFICEQTVKDHLHAIFEKLEIRSRGELTAKVLGLRPGNLSPQNPRAGHKSLR